MKEYDSIYQGIYNVEVIRAIILGFVDRAKRVQPQFEKDGEEAGREEEEEC